MTVIADLKDFIMCPIKLETTSDMVIFNSQCYNSPSFHTHLTAEEDCNQQYVESEYEDLETHLRLKCPRTGTNFQYNDAIQNLHFDVISRES